MSWFFDEKENPYPGRIVFAILAACVAIVVALVVFFGVLTPAIGRYQERQQRQQDRTQALRDANNKVRVSSVEIRNQQQRIRVAKQRAAIRQQNAIGIREAQDEIAKTLTPLYVQFEMTQALLEIARSGKNNSVVYLPSGANGIPLVSTVDPTQVRSPDGNGN